MTPEQLTAANLKFREKKAGSIADILEREYEGRSDWEASAKDLLTDLQHFCDFYGQDFDKLVASARNHYSAEVCADDLHEDVLEQEVKRG